MLAKLKKLLQVVESKLLAFLDTEMPVVHTAWQTAAGALVAGLVTVRSTTDVKILVTSVVAIFLAALKSAYLNSRV